MESSLWDKIKQSVIESASVAAEKAEYLGRIGRARLDIAETRNTIRDRFADLGGLVYERLHAGGSGDMATQDDIKELTQTISDLEDELKKREDALEHLRAETGDEETIEGV